MGWKPSKVVKNASLVAVITALSSLAGKPLPDLSTLYQVAIASALAGLLSYQKEEQTTEQEQTQQVQNQQALKLLDF